MRLSLLVAAVLFATDASSANAAVTFVSASYQLQTSTTSRVNEDGDSSYPTITSLPASSFDGSSSSATQGGYIAYDDISATVSFSTTFNDPASGTVISNLAASVTTYDPIEAEATAQSSLRGTLIYTFTIDRPSIVTFDYRTSATGQTIFNTPPAQLAEVAISTVGIYFQKLDGAGSASSQVLTPRTYSIRIDSPDIRVAVDKGGTGFGSASASIFSLVNFRITEAVPEPATWGMMVVGFGMIGSTMRRRQRTVTLSA